MRTRLWAFVTFLGLIGCGASTGGGGGSSWVYCGVGGACPTGLKCSAQNFCVPAGTTGDAGVTDSINEPDVTASGTDVTSGGTDAAAQDTPQPIDVKVDTSKPDTFVPDIASPDVQTGAQTVSEIEQAESSVNCATLDGITDSASDVSLEAVVVTSPPIALKGSGGVYFTSFFVESNSGGAADGSWMGIQVIVTASPFTVSVGDVLNIKGTVKEFYCMTEISAAPGDVVNTGNFGPDVPAHTVFVSIFGDNATAEPFEGGLVKITNVQIGDPNPIATDGKTHGQATINHNGGNVSVLFAPAYGSAYLGTSTNGATTTFAAGQAFASITGNVQWSFGQWVVRARSDADIVLK